MYQDLILIAYANTEYRKIIEDDSFGSNFGAGFWFVTIVSAIFTAYAIYQSYKERGGI